DRNLPGVIMEFKQTEARDELEQAAKQALAQIQAKDYGAEFADHPPKGILRLGIGFCGKRTAVAHKHV
ncbi:MAG: PD-(D/E)XK nuclease domain-containing protein, partial [Myxococcota bacterium]